MNRIASDYTTADAQACDVAGAKFSWQPIIPRFPMFERCQDQFAGIHMGPVNQGGDDSGVSSLATICAPISTDQTSREVDANPSTSVVSRYEAAMQHPIPNGAVLLHQKEECMIDVMEEFQKLLGQNDRTSPEQLAAEVFGRLRRADKDELAQEMLREKAREAIRKARQIKGERISEPDPTPVAAASGMGGRPLRSGKGSTTKRSSAVQMIQSWVRERAKVDRMFVGKDSPGNEDGWKMLNDCTARDLAFIAEGHRTRAKAAEREASRVEQLMAAMAQGGGSTVADIPDSALEGYYS